MDRASVVLAGRVSTRAGDGLAGGLVELFDQNTGAVVARTATTADGEYRLHLSADRDIAAFAKGTKLSMRVSDAQGEVVAKRAKVDVRPGNDVAVDLSIAAGRLKDFEPAVEVLAPTSGPLLDPETYPIIDAAVGMLVPPGEPGHLRLMRAARCPMPDILSVGSLLDDAWGVLGGDVLAEQRLRTVLDHFAGRGTQPPQLREVLSVENTVTKRPPGRGLSTGTTLSHARALRSPGRIPIDRPSFPCALPRDRYLPVAAAALHMAVSERDALHLLGGLEGGLCGFDRVNALYGAALDTLRTGSGAGLRGLLEVFGGECGPDDGPLPPFPEPRPAPPCPDPRPPGIPDRDLCRIERWDCLYELAGAFRERQVWGSYAITSLAPAAACPGDVIAIRGSNFGINGGLVCFQTTSSGPLCVVARSWSDTEIEVEVPAGAVAGPVTLKISEGTLVVCGSAIPLFRRGNSAVLTGGAAAIASLRVDGRSGSVCVPPDRDMTITWSAAPAGAPVRVRVARGATVLLDESGLGSSGALTFRTPAGTTTRELTITASTTSACGSGSRTLTVQVTVVPTLVIEGLEVTQGIQRFWREGITANSLPTFAAKDTIVRVYVSTDLGGFDNDRVSNVTGTLRVGTTTLTPINGVTPDNPGGANPFIVARRRDLIDREQTDHTLNFRIPAALASGTRTLRAEVTAPAMCGTTPRATQLLTWTWNTQPALRVRFVRIRDDRPAPEGTSQRPTEDQARMTVQRAFDLLPSPPTDIGPAWRALWNTTRAFHTLDGLSALLADLEDEHNCSAWEWLWAWTGATDCPDDDEAIWICLTAPFNRGVARRPGNTCLAAMHTVAQGQAAIPRTTPAHELAHNLGFRHVNRVCGTATIGGEFYSHPDNGDLQDVPFDPFWNQAISGTVQDFMSYGCTVWTSADSWGRLQSAI